MWMSLVSHSLIEVFLYDLPVSLATADPERLSVLDHYQEYGCAGHANKGYRDKAVLVPKVIYPGCDTMVCKLLSLLELQILTYP